MYKNVTSLLRASHRRQKSERRTAFRQLVVIRPVAFCEQTKKTIKISQTQHSFIENLVPKRVAALVFY